MFAPAVALSSEFWKRHRLDLAGVCGVILVMIVACQISPPRDTLTVMLSVCFCIGLCYVIAIISYGFETPLESPESGFPSRFYLLPVRTSLLVAIPMALGMVVATALWLCWDHFVFAPAQFHFPDWWPVILPALVATGQAVLWFPFGLPWLRLVAGCALFLSLFWFQSLVISIATTLGVPPEWLKDREHLNLCLKAVGAVAIPSAFLIAQLGVGLARRGDSPNFQRLFNWLARPVANSSPGSAFPSPMRAQLWYEWRLRTRYFVVTVSTLLAVFMAWGLFISNANQRADFAIIFVFLPPLIATFYGPQLGSPGETIRSTALTTFAASRPLSDFSLVIAKLGALTATSAITWAIVFSASVIWVALNADLDQMELLWEGAIKKYGRNETEGILALFAVIAVFGAWRSLVVNLWIGLSGRTWMVPAHSFLLAMLLFQVVGGWITVSANEYDQLKKWLSIALFFAVSFKFIIYMRALTVSHRRGLLNGKAILAISATWLLATLALGFFLLWFVPPSLLSPTTLILGLILFVPLARLSAAPLAVSWNRHR